MADKSEQNIGFEDFMAGWMKNSMSFFTSMPSMWTGMNMAFTNTSTQKKDEKDKISKSFETAQKTWESLLKAMNEPETLKTMLKGTGVLPEICLKIAQTGLGNFTHFQRQWLKRAGKVHESTKAYKFENLDEDMMKVWSELYEQEFSKFLNIPQLGLTRFYQEKFIRAVDKYNVFQAGVSEFFRILSLPMEKSFKVLQEELTKLAEDAEKAQEQVQKASDVLLEPLETKISTTPYDIVYEEDRVKLKHYKPVGKVQLKRPLLVVYALINRETMLDLQPGRSVVRNFSEAGIDL